MWSAWPDRSRDTFIKKLNLAPTTMCGKPARLSSPVRLQSPSESGDVTPTDSRPRSPDQPHPFYEYKQEREIFNVPSSRVRRS